MEELAFSFLPSHDWSLAEQVQLQSDVGNGDGADSDADAYVLGLVFPLILGEPPHGDYYHHQHHHHNRVRTVDVHCPPSTL